MCASDDPSRCCGAYGHHSSDRPIRNIRCEAIGSRARAAVAAFLRDHGDSTLHATVVLLESHVRDREAALSIAGIEAQVDLVTPAAPVWFSSRSASPLARLTAVVVLPTPPFSFAIVIVMDIISLSLAIFTRIGADSCFEVLFPLIFTRNQIIAWIACKFNRIVLNLVKLTVISVTLLLLINFRAIIVVQEA